MAFWIPLQIAGAAIIAALVAYIVKSSIRPANFPPGKQIRYDRV
jgi:hypothetical protein